MRAAKASGAKVLAITSFARSAAAELADVALVRRAARRQSFRDELIHTSRAAHMLLTEQLVICSSTTVVTGMREPCRCRCWERAAGVASEQQRARLLNLALRRLLR